MTNVVPSGKQVIEKVVKTFETKHLKLEEEKDPRLSADLDAAGHNIKGAGDVECNSVNGGKPVTEKSLVIQLEELLHKIEVRFALGSHSHEEFPVIAEELGSQKVEIEKLKESPPNEHSHELDKLRGKLPLEKIEYGKEILALLRRNLAEVNHYHPDLINSIEKLNNALRSIEIPEQYDDGAILSEIEVLSRRVAGAEDKLQKREQPIVEIEIRQTPAAQITCRADYVILESNPGKAEVQDAEEMQGTVRIVGREGKYLVRATFKRSPVQPLTFLFPFSPVVCGIGSSPDTQVN